MKMKQILCAAARLRCRLGQKRYCSGGVAKHQFETEVIIPAKIERNPTDILRALSCTVAHDIVAPHYKYHDDPYLIPSSNIGKRTFALAKESGRKAAQWIHRQHSDLFDTTIAEPSIPALTPRTVFTDDSQVTESDLLNLIRTIRVSDAITVFELLDKQNIQLSVSSLQSLLELLCFYNAEDPLPDDLVEERWFRQGNNREKQRKTWKDSGVAELVFSKLESQLEDKQPELTRAKCALIRGMCKFCQVDKAWETFQTMRATGQFVDCETFNSLIRAANFLKEGGEARWQFVEDIFREMAAAKVSPNLGTLNASLEVLTTMAGLRQSRSVALRTLAEFKQAGVTPSLASYYYLLGIFCRERGPVSNILEEIIEELEGKPLVIRDVKDTFFFVTGMDVCRNHLGDPILARRLHALLHAHNNYDLIGDSFKESIYYRHFFTVICNLEPLDSFLQLYNKYVPHIYIPEPSVMEEIVRSVQLHEAWSELPRLWSDILVFDQVNRISLVALWLESAVLAKQKLESIDQIGLAADLCRSARQLWDKIEGQDSDRTNPIRWNGPMLGDVMQLVLRAQDFEFACQVLDKLCLEIGTSAPPSIDSLREFLSAALGNQQTNKAVLCVEYAIDAGFPEAAILAAELREKAQLTPNQLSHLTSMLGTV